MHFGITGGRGTLGKIAQAQLLTAGHRVSLFAGDVCSTNQLKAWLQETQPEAIIHFAAVVPTQVVQAQPVRAFQVNVGGTANLVAALQACALRPWLFYASSSHVYQSQARPIRETDPIAPVTVYGLTKRMGEQVVEASAPAANLKFCIGRIFSFFHPSQTGSFLYPTLMKRLSTEDLAQPFLLSGADDVRDLSPAEDIVSQIIALAQCQAEGIYNLGSGQGTRIADFVQALTPQPLQIKNATATPSTSLVADISKLKARLSR